MNSPDEDSAAAYDRACWTLLNELKRGLPKPGPHNENYHQRVLGIIDNTVWNVRARNPFSLDKC